MEVSLRSPQLFTELSVDTADVSTAEQDLEETMSEVSLEKSALEEGIDVSRSGGPASITARKAQSLFDETG